MEAGGFEPPSRNRQASDNKELTQKQNPVLDTCLDILLQKHPDLQQIITAWPKLPEHIKQSVNALIGVYTSTKKQE
jgi:hypothetical protein